MKEYVTNLRQRFGNSEKLASFMGVSTDTVKSWTSGRSTPRSIELRFLQVLGMLAIDAPHVFDALSNKVEPLKCKPVTILPPLAPLPSFLAPNDPMTAPMSHEEQVKRWDEVTAPKRAWWDTDELRASVAQRKIDHPELYEPVDPLDIRDDFYESLAATQAANSPAPIAPKSEWLTDAYWFARTMGHEDDKPIVDPVSFLRAMSDDEEQGYCDLGNAYCKRTGRVWPDR